MDRIKFYYNIATVGALHGIFFNDIAFLPCTLLDYYLIERQFKTIFCSSYRWSFMPQGTQIRLCDGGFYYGQPYLGLADRSAEKPITCTCAKNLERNSTELGYACGVWENKTASVRADAAAQPNIALFSCSERYINSLLTVPGDILRQVDRVPGQENILPPQTTSYQGMWLDNCNNQKPAVQGEPPNSLIGDSEVITLVGWAADSSAMQPFSGLYLEVGDRLLQCSYGIKRESVANHFKNNALTMTGFTVSIPAAYLAEQNAQTLAFIQLTADGSACYTPVEYYLLDAAA